MAEAQKRNALVTGANKGIGLEICKQLAERGNEAVKNLKKSGLSDVVFHQLDVADSASIFSLADFIKKKFGKLDILVNNAGISGVETDKDSFITAVCNPDAQINWSVIVTQTYDLTEACLKTNYYGAKIMCETFVPLLQLSDSPRIVNVSSSLGKIKNVLNEWAKKNLSDGKNLTEEKVKEVLNGYLRDFKEETFEAKGWPAVMSAYILSKAAMNAYTRILAKKHPTFCINRVCPGYVKTDINFNTGNFTVEEGAEAPVRLALIPNGGPSGLFFSRSEELQF